MQIRTERLDNLFRRPEANEDTLDGAFIEAVDTLYLELNKYILQTPTIRSEFFSERFECNLYLKMENLQYTGAFKLRGALAKAMASHPDPRNPGFITASSGNHGIGVAYAARQFGRRAKIYVPSITPENKIAKIQNYGGEVCIHGADWDEACLAAKKEALATGMVFIHPFDDEIVMQGQATIAKEILRAVPDTDAIVCSVGGGGLISGMARYAKMFRPQMVLYGVETQGTHSMAHSLAHGKVTALQTIDSIAESIGVKKVSEKTFQYIKSFVDKVLTVSDEEALLSMLEYFREHNALIEPATSCCLAALEQLPKEAVKDKNIVVVISGGNFSPRIMDAALSSYAQYPEKICG